MQNTGKAVPHRHSLVLAVCWRRPESLQGEQHKQGGLTIPFWVTCGYSVPSDRAEGPERGCLSDTP